MHLFFRTYIVQETPGGRWLLLRAHRLLVTGRWRPLRRLLLRPRVLNVEQPARAANKLFVWGSVV
jgi:hypothetical protein